MNAFVLIVMRSDDPRELVAGGDFSHTSVLRGPQNAPRWLPIREATSRMYLYCGATTPDAMPSGGRPTIIQDLFFGMSRYTLGIPSFK